MTMIPTPALPPRRFVRTRAWPVVALALALAGCESVGGAISRGPGVVERVDADPKDSAANIASLNDVVKRNPNDPEPYNTRGVAYAKIGCGSEPAEEADETVWTR